MNVEPTRHFAKITETALDGLRARKNVRIENTAEPWCYEATRDNIRHYAHGIGDDNPLWCDPDYAAKTRFGGIVALPSFLFTTSRIISGYVGGIPGVHAMWAGADWTWHKPVLRNQTITTEAWLKDLIEHETQVRRTCHPADLPRQLLQSRWRPGGRGRQLVLPHRPRPGARAGNEIQRSPRPQAACLYRRGTGPRL